MDEIKEKLEAEAKIKDEELRRAENVGKKQANNIATLEGQLREKSKEMKKKNKKGMKGN